MKIAFLNEYDIVNYKKPSMFLGFPRCSGKCNLLNNKIICQNQFLQQAEKYDVSISELIEKYRNNHLVKAVVCGGLEPFDSPIELTEFLAAFRKNFKDDIVIYTGYNKEELQAQLVLAHLKEENIKNVIIKFGRYIEGDLPHYDKVLGVNLASNNQYAEKVL